MEHSEGPGSYLQTVYSEQDSQIYYGEKLRIHHPDNTFRRNLLSALAINKNSLKKLKPNSDWNKFMWWVNIKYAVVRNNSKIRINEGCMAEMSTGNSSKSISWVTQSTWKRLNKNKMFVPRMLFWSPWSFMWNPPVQSGQLPAGLYTLYSRVNNTTTHYIPDTAARRMGLIHILLCRWPWQ